MLSAWQKQAEVAVLEPLYPSPEAEPEEVAEAAQERMSAALAWPVFTPPKGYVPGQTPGRRQQLASPPARRVRGVAARSPSPAAARAARRRAPAHEEPEEEEEAEEPLRSPSPKRGRTRAKSMATGATAGRAAASPSPKPRGRAARKSIAA